MNLRIAAPILFGVLGTAALLMLGAWQISRLQWKEARIAEMDSRLKAPAVDLPATVGPKTHDFRKVRVRGSFREGRQAAFLTSQKPDGPGYRIITAFAAEDGRAILIDRGYVPEAMRNEIPPPQTSLIIEGVLRWPDETTTMTPAPDLELGLWFARDVPALAAALATEPILVVATGGGEAGADDWPRRSPPRINPPNDHLEYAITWFSLAAIWAVMGVLLVRRERRRTD